MGVDVPAVVLGALLGALSTGFAFALTTGKQIVTMSARLDGMGHELQGLQRQFAEVAEWRLKPRRDDGR